MDQYLILSSLLFFLGFFCIVLNRKNIPVVIFCISLFCGCLFHGFEGGFKVESLKSGFIHYFEMTTFVVLYGFFMAILILLITYSILEELWKGRSFFSFYMFQMFTALISCLLILFGLLPSLLFFVDSDLLLFYYRNYLSEYDLGAITYPEFYMLHMKGDPKIVPSEELQGRASSSRILEDGSTLKCEDFRQAFRLGAQLSKTRIPDFLLEGFYQGGKLISGKSDLQCTIEPPVISQDYPPGYMPKK